MKRENYSTGEVILFSGGMDSVALSKLYPKSKLLYFNLHTGYNEAEMRRLPERCEVIDIDLGQWERQDKIIPMRNLILVSIASMYGDIIYIGATAGDRVLDKSSVFLKFSSQILSYLWEPQHWTTGRDIQVLAPLKMMTKTQIVAACKSKKISLQELASESFSCYTPEHEVLADKLNECGKCKPCFRKWVAFENNGFRLDAMFREKAARYGLSIRSEILSRGSQEYNETCKAYEAFGGNIAREWFSL